MLYLETSALLRAAIQRQPEVLERMKQVPDWVTSALTLVECERALVAMKHRKIITARRRTDAMTYLRDVAWHAEASEIDSWIFERTIQAFPVEPVKTLDGLHLASILRWAEKGPVEVITCDRRVMLNAKAFGFPVAYFPDEPRA
jgi:hypothetical protein